MKIIVTGSLAFDRLMRFPGSFKEHILPEKIDELSVSFLVDKLDVNRGGVAANICHHLAVMGDRPVCLACLGKDGSEYVQELKDIGVDVKGVRVVEDDYTASFVVISDEGLRQVAGFYPGAMRRDVDLKLGDVMNSQKTKDGFVVIAPTMPEAMENYVEEAMDLGLRYLFLPAQQIPRLSKKMLIKGISNAEVFVGNDYEIAMCVKVTGMSEKEMLSKVQVMVKTLGEKGSLIRTREGKVIRVGAVKPKKIVDPTGAGDAWVAGFLSKYLEGESLKLAGESGARLAARVLSVVGTRG